MIDDDEQGRSGTPKPAADRDGGSTAAQKMKETVGENSQESGEIAVAEGEPRTSSDLPTDVRVKLRKLEKLEARYHGA